MTITSIALLFLVILAIARNNIMHFASLNFFTRLATWVSLVLLLTGTIASLMYRTQDLDFIGSPWWYTFAATPVVFFLLSVAGLLREARRL